MTWELVAIWAICGASVAGFVWSERRQSAAAPSPAQPSVAAPADPGLRRRRLRAIGF